MSVEYSKMIKVKAQFFTLEVRKQYLFHSNSKIHNKDFLGQLGLLKEE